MVTWTDGTVMEPCVPGPSALGHGTPGGRPPVFTTTGSRRGSGPPARSALRWSQLRSMLEYKAQWYGREVIAVDRWFPSSKLCSACGRLRQKMPLHVRTWTCDCGTTHDRDVNAAKNILAVGLTASVCGAGVRPQRKLRAGSRRRSRNPYSASRRNPPLSGGGGSQVDSRLRGKRETLPWPPGSGASGHRRTTPPGPLETTHLNHKLHTLSNLARIGARLSDPSVAPAAGSCSPGYPGAGTFAASTTRRTHKRGQWSTVPAGRPRLR